MTKKLILRLGVIAVVAMAAIFLLRSVFSNGSPQTGIPISHTFCVDSSSVFVITQDSAYRKDYYQFCLIDSFAHYYVKTIVFNGDTFAVSTLNYPGFREGSGKAIALSGRVLSKEVVKENGIGLFTSVNGKFLSRALLPDYTFKTIAVIDHFGDDSLKIRQVFEHQPLLQLVRKCQ